MLVRVQNSFLIVFSAKLQNKLIKDS